MPEIDGGTRAVLERLIDRYLEQTTKPGEILDKIRQDEHKVWAVLVLLRWHRDPELISYTFEKLKELNKSRESAVGTHPLGALVDVVRIGSSHEQRRELVPQLIKLRWFKIAEQFQRDMQTEFTPEQVREIGRAYLKGAVRSSEDQEHMAAIYRRVLGRDGEAEFLAAVKKDEDEYVSL